MIEINSVSTFFHLELTIELFIHQTDQLDLFSIKMNLI
jgi:hypothetical protein